MINAKKIFIFILLTFSVCYIMSAASFNVDKLQLINSSGFDSADGKYKGNTYTDIAFSFEGGYKFGAKIGLKMNTNDMISSYPNVNDSVYNKVFMLLNNVELTAKNLFDSHLFLTVWTGSYKYLGFESDYDGNMFIPDSESDRFEGAYKIKGSGFSAELRFWEERIRFTLHLYENTNFVTNTTQDAFNFFALDFEFALFLKYFRMDFFIGGTNDLIIPVEDTILEYGRGKTGFSFWVGDSDYADFKATFALPALDYYYCNEVQNGNINFFDIIYLSADLHFRIFVTDHYVSFLTRPLSHNDIDSGYKTDVDVQYRMNVKVGDFPIGGGFIFNFQYADYNPKYGTDHISASLAPYMSVDYSGIHYQFCISYDFASIHYAQEHSNDIESFSGLKFIISASTSF